MIYDLEGKYGKNWILAENDVMTDGELPANYESIFCQGNGYMCIRASAEEKCSPSPGSFTLVAGTFDTADQADCNELANMPDTVHFAVSVAGTLMDFEKAVSGSYLRTLCLRDGLLTRRFEQEINGRVFTAEFRRIVSISDTHLSVSEITIKSGDKEGFSFSAEGGIDGCHYGGMGHLADGVRSASDGVMQVITRTKQSEIRASVTEFVAYALEKDGVRTPFKAKETFDTSSDRNCVVYRSEVDVPDGYSLVVTKYAVIHTSRDRGNELFGVSEFRALGDAHIRAAAARSFEEHFAESAAEWERKIWSHRDVTIAGNDRDQLALRFALYHLTVMSPVHDNRMNIGAKGLSGPGYYGHAFWDTEIYMLPYFIFEAPDEARSLVEYRVNSLPAVRRNAKKGGHRGARFCWESAWITDGEATPVWCDTGDLELHITADVAMGAYYYYVVSGDEEFMRKGGYELIFETANFWASRVTFNEERGKYEINDVTGPNEYHTHVNNNAYTNYLARYNLRLAMKFRDEIKASDPNLFSELNSRFNIDGSYENWERTANAIFIPEPDENGIIPEHDGYFDLAKIVEDDGASASEGGANWDLINSLGGIEHCQCSKQADVPALLYLLEDQFSAECKKKNFYFYEHNCFHSSSLSLNTFSCLASDMGEIDMAYSMFERAAMIDMCDTPHGSGIGIHSASLGGIWQCVVLGFGGVRRFGNSLRVEPHLPDAWDHLDFEISWKGQRLKIHEEKTFFTVENITPMEKRSLCAFISGGREYNVGEGTVFVEVVSG